MKKLIALAALIPALALAASSTNMPDAAKKSFMQGKFEVPAALCTGNGVPSRCCTAAATGANCPKYYMTLVTSTATGDTTATTKTALGNEISCTGTCTGWAAGGWELTALSVGIASNHACWDFSTKAYSASSATITARQAVIYRKYQGTDPDTTDNIVSIHCLDGGSCAGDVSSSNGTYTVTLPTNVVCVN